MQDISFFRGDQKNAEPPLQSSSPSSPISQEAVTVESGVSNSGQQNVSPPVLSSGLENTVFSDQNSGGGGRKKGLRLTMIIAGIVLLLGGIAAGSVWAYTRYEKVYKEVSIEKILPKDVDFFARVSIHSNSSQVKLLEEIMKKFPGYDFIRKEMDSTGEGKDAGDSFIDSWKEIGVSFDDEVLPSLGDSATVVIPDLYPVEQVVGKELGAAFGQAGESLLAFNGDQNEQKKVLGWEGSVRSVENSGKKVEVPALDFILSAPISDMQKALEVMKKISEKEGRYQITKHNYKGYTYIELFDTKYEAKEKGSEQTLQLNASRTYHSILGGNWVSVSVDNWMKEIIDRRDAELLFSFAERKQSFENNETIHRILNSLQADGDNLVTLYYKWNASNSCSGSDFCSYGMKDQGMQEGGLSLRLDGEGGVLRSYRLQGDNDFRQQKNEYRNGLASRVSKKAGNRWVDIFFEVPDMKGAYYDFKRNTLTEKGTSEWNSNLEEMASVTGFHLERDFVDHLAGSFGFGLLTAKNKMPEGALIAEFSEGEKFIRGVFSMIIEQENATIKRTQEMCKNAMKNPTAYGTSMRNYCKGQNFTPASLEEKRGDFGVWMHVKGGSFSSEGFDLCGGVGTDNIMVLASSCFAVESFLSVKPGVGEGSLSNDEEYVFAGKYVGDDGYGRAHIVPLGIFYAIQGMYFSLEQSFSEPVGGWGYAEENAQREKEMEDMFFVWESIARTIPSVTVQSEEPGASTLFFHIKELPAEEKEKANTVLERIMSGISRARSSAQSASFKAQMSSLVPSLIICCDEGGTLMTKPGESVCGGKGKTTASLFTADKLRVDSVEYRVKKNCDASGNFEFEVIVPGGEICPGTTVLTQEGARFPEGC